MNKIILITAICSCIVELIGLVLKIIEIMRNKKDRS